MQSEYHKPAESKQPNRGTAHNLLRPKAATLSEHDASYLRERAVTEAVAKAAGYWTALKPSEHPEAFSQFQRRRTPTLIAPHLSPDGVSVGYQKRDLRPVRDRKGKAIKWASPKDARLVLSAHPWTVDAVREGTGRLWIPEGLTRLHALTGLGEVAVSYAGCHAWKQDGEPLGCFDYVNLNGRLVLDVPDADYRTNSKVQKALAERVAFLESRGARVLVVSTPEVDGDPNTGLDDYIAAGGNLETLVRDAHPFVPVDAGRERLKRDEALRVFQAAKRSEIEELPARKVGECGALKVARYLVEISTPNHGKPRAGGVVVHPSIRQVAAGVRIGIRAVSNALARLEEVEFLKLLDEPRARHEAASYLLLDPSLGGGALSKHVEKKGIAGKESEEYREEEETSLYKRESSSRVYSVHPGVKSEKGAEKLPALRNSKLVHTWGRKNGRRVVVHSDYFKRYGAKGEEIIRHVLEGGHVTPEELRERFGAKTSKLGRFFKTWVKPFIDDGVLAGGLGGVEMAPGWHEALERVQERTDEPLDNRLQDRKYADQQKAFRRAKDLPTDPTPGLAGPDRSAEIFERAEERDREARIEEQRRKVGMTAEVFLADALQDASGFGWRELRALWIAKGGRAEDLRRAVKDPYQFLRDNNDGPLYVVRTIEGHSTIVERDPAPVAVLRDPTSPLKMPEKGSDAIYHHDAFCDCDWCDSPSQPRYARPWSAV